MPGLFVLYACVGVALTMWFDRAKYPKFKALTDTRDRQRMFRNSLLRSFFFLGAPALLGLFLIDRFNALFEMPIIIDQARQGMAKTVGLNPATVTTLAFDLAFGLIAIMVFLGLAPVLLKAKIDGAPSRTVGDIDAVMPRNRREIIWGGFLSINAGISEELFFRLVLVFAVFAVTGHLDIACAVSIILFGLVHAYQGVTGVITAMLGGAGLTFLYIATGSFWIVAALHIVMDLRALVLVPIALGIWGRDETVQSLTPGETRSG
jgi:membrane protease YdiL (CAAX protease family)